MLETSGDSSLLETLRQRLPFLLLALLLFSLVLMVRLTALAIGALSAPDAEFVAAQREALYEATVHFSGARGTIYDRAGAELAINQSACSVAINPPLITEPLQAARSLAPILNRNVRELYEIADGDLLWHSLVNALTPLPGEACQQLDELDIYGLEVVRLQRRIYPQGELAAQIIGFINFDASRPSGFGIEGYYHNLLAGNARDVRVSDNVYESPPDRQEIDRGRDLILNIDSGLQFAAETRLREGMVASEAISGSIIVLEVSSGKVLAMANWPGYDPNRFYEVEEPKLLLNAAISQSYEPGAIMIPITLAGALEQGYISSQWRILDRGEQVFGNDRIINADRVAYGEVNVEEIIRHRTNIGAAQAAMAMGASAYYEALGRFGIGEITGIDLAGESAGELNRPGQADWTDRNLARNAIGQRLEVTPIQLAAIYAAIANHGLLMPPHLVAHIVDHAQEGAARFLEPSTLAYGKRVLSAETADYLQAILARNLSGEMAYLTEVPGYSMGGIWAKAEIPNLAGYYEQEFMMTFIGLTPAQEPEVVFLLVLEQPRTDISTEKVLGPIAQQLLGDIVMLLEIPPDALRG